MQFKKQKHNFVFPVLERRDGSSGRTYHENDGTVYDSVTTFLGWKEQKKWENWRKNNPGKSEAATDRGTEIHSVIEDYLSNVPFESLNFAPIRPDNHISNKMMFGLIRRHLDKIDNIFVQEQSLRSKNLGLAGTVDCIAEYDGVLSIIDFKTSRREKNADEIQNYYLQGCCYSLMWEELTGMKIDDVAILVVNDQGTCQKFCVKAKKYIPVLARRLKEYRHECSVRDRK